MLPRQLAGSPRWEPAQPGPLRPRRSFPSPGSPRLSARPAETEAGWGGWLVVHLRQEAVAVTPGTAPKP